jgi:xylulokinase
VSADAVVLGIDQGLSGARAGVMTTDGRLMGRGRAPCTDVRRVAGVLEHDPSAWCGEIRTAARMALAEAGVGSVDAIGIGALGPAPVLLDEALRPVAAAPLFPQDPATPFRTWAETDPGITDRAAWVVDACGFLVSDLVGRPVLDRITAADHVVPDGWPALRRPEVEEPFATAGGLTSQAATRLDLAAGTPVTVGTYDTFVDLAAVGVRGPGDRGILLGSTLIVGMVRGDEHAPEGLRASRHAGAGWFVGGWTQAAGRALAWWLGLFPSAVREEIAREAAGLPPGAGGLLALPYLDGERSPAWDPAARGAFVGLTTATTAAELYRATIDAVALSAADLADRTRSMGAGHPWLVAGGGVRDATWLQATVDAVGEPMLVADLADAGGAARSAFRALGVPVPDLPTRRVEPNPDRHRLFSRLLAPYRALHGALASTVRALTPDAPR